MRPFFTVVITTYNRAQFLSKAIESVQNQSFSDFELIIIDDGSIDDTKNVVSPFLQDSRIKYFFQENQERSISRNNGIKKSNGEYICFLDSDDYYLSDHLSVFNNYIEQLKCPKNVIFYSGRMIEDKGEVVKKPYQYKPSYDKVENIIFFGLFESPANITTCIHRDFQKDVLFENEWLPFNEIYHFVLRLIVKNYVLFYIDNYTSVIVRHGENTTSNSAFFQGRYDYITHYSNIFDISNNELIKLRRVELLLCSIFDEDVSFLKIKKIIQLLLLDPMIILSRQFWSAIKSIIC